MPPAMVLSDPELVIPVAAAVNAVTKQLHSNKGFPNSVFNQEYVDLVARAAGGPRKLPRAEHDTLVHVLKYRALNFRQFTHQGRPTSPSVDDVVALIKLHFEDGRSEPPFFHVILILTISLAEGIIMAAATALSVLAEWENVRPLAQKYFPVDYHHVMQIVTRDTYFTSDGIPISQDARETTARENMMTRVLPNLRTHSHLYPRSGIPDQSKSAFDFLEVSAMDTKPITSHFSVLSKSMPEAPKPKHCESPPGTALLSPPSSRKWVSPPVPTTNVNPQSQPSQFKYPSRLDDKLTSGKSIAEALGMKRPGGLLKRPPFEIESPKHQQRKFPKVARPEVVDLCDDTAVDNLKPCASEPSPSQEPWMSNDVLHVMEALDCGPDIAMQKLAQSSGDVQKVLWGASEETFNFTSSDASGSGHASMLKSTAADAFADFKVCLKPHIHTHTHTAHTSICSHMCVL